MDKRRTPGHGAKTAGHPTSLQFFGRLLWLDGRPLQIEEYRRRIFGQALDEVGPDGHPRYSMVVSGRGKKNSKTLDLVLAALYVLVIRKWGSQGVLDISPVTFSFPPVVLRQTPANTTVTGGSVIGGGHLGCDLQWTPFLVIGVEGDFMGAGLNATGHAQSLFGGVAAPGGGITWSSRLDSIATLRGRVGWAWTPNTLVYLTGGGAWGRTSYSSTDVFFSGCPVCATTSFSNTSSGYVLGGGLEWAPWSNNWIVRGEYLYYNLSGATGGGFLPGVGFTAANPTWSNMAVSSGRLGLSYKF